MFFVRDVAKDDLYAFVDADKRNAARKAWDKGIDCILKSQVCVNGKLTAWCAQHDEKTLEPRPARRLARSRQHRPQPIEHDALRVLEGRRG